MAALSAHLNGVSLNDAQQVYAQKLVAILGDVVQGAVNERNTADPTQLLLRQLARRIVEKDDDATVFRDDVEHHREILKDARERDFDFFDRVGKGTFGVVTLAKLRRDSWQMPFALKIMKKMTIIRLEMAEYIKREMRMQASLDHPFIANLLGAYEDSSRVYMMLEYMNGGELFTLIREQKMLTTEATRFYAAEMTLVFEYLHSQDIVYRDLKPENILLSRQGHVKLCDFGFSKVLKKGEKAYTAFGTPAYMAPEIVKGKSGYDHGVDWWALGVLIYEMRVGNAPFKHRNSCTVLSQVAQGNIQYPAHLTGWDKDICQRLMHPTLSSRLGVKEGGPQKIKEHKFFTACEPAFDWEACANGKNDGPHPFKHLAPDDISRYNFTQDGEGALGDEEELSEEQKTQYKSFFCS